MFPMLAARVDHDNLADSLRYGWNFAVGNARRRNQNAPAAGCVKCRQVFGVPSARQQSDPARLVDDNGGLGYDFAERWHHDNGACARRINIRQPDLVEAFDGAVSAAMIKRHRWQALPKPGDCDAKAC